MCDSRRARGVYGASHTIFYFIGDDKNSSYKLKLEKAIYKNKLNQNCKILGHLPKEDLKLMYKSAKVTVRS